MENRTFPSPTLGAPAYGQDRAAATPGPARTEGRSGPVAPSRSLRARRRRPAVIAMAAALIAAGGLGGAILYNSTGQRIAVLALAHDVPYGQPLTAADLVVARIASDPALSPVSASDLSRAIGQRATTDLHQGSLLMVADLTAALVVQPDQQVVGLSVKSTQLPSAGLQPGQRVVIVLTADQSGAGVGAGTGHGPMTMDAVVARIGKAASDGGQVIDVAVPPASGPLLAAWVAGGKFQVILAPRDAGKAASPTASGAPAAWLSHGGGDA